MKVRNKVEQSFGITCHLGSPRCTVPYLFGVSAFCSSRGSIQTACKPMWWPGAMTRSSRTSTPVPFFVPSADPVSTTTINCQHRQIRTRRRDSCKKIILPARVRRRHPGPKMAPTGPKVP